MGRFGLLVLLAALPWLAVSAVEVDLKNCASALLTLASSPACIAAEDVGTCDAGCTQLAQSIPEECGSSAVEDRLHANAVGLGFLQRLVELCSWNQSFATALTTGASVRFNSRPHVPRSRADPKTYECLSQFQQLMYADTCFTDHGFTNADSDCAASSECTKRVAALPEDCVTDAFYERFSSTTMHLQYVLLLQSCQWDKSMAPALHSILSRATAGGGQVDFSFSMETGGSSTDKGQEPAGADQVPARCLVQLKQLVDSKDCAAALATGNCAACDARSDAMPAECATGATWGKLRAQDPTTFAQLARLAAKCSSEEQAGNLDNGAPDTSVPIDTASSAKREAAPAKAGQPQQHAQPSAQECQEALGPLVDSLECSAALSSGACIDCTAKAAGVPSECASDAVFGHLAAQDPATLIKLSELVRACGADGTGLLHHSAPLLSTWVKSASPVAAAYVGPNATSGGPHTNPQPSPTHHIIGSIGAVLVVAAAVAAVWLWAAKRHQQGPVNTYRAIALV